MSHGRQRSTPSDRPSLWLDCRSPWLEWCSESGVGVSALVEACLDAVVPPSLSGTAQFANVARLPDVVVPLSPFATIRVAPV